MRRDGEIFARGPRINNAPRAESLSNRSALDRSTPLAGVDNDGRDRECRDLGLGLAARPGGDDHMLAGSTMTFALLLCSDQRLVAVALFIGPARLDLIDALSAGLLRGDHAHLAVGIRRFGVADLAGPAVGAGLAQAILEQLVK